MVPDAALEAVQVLLDTRLGYGLVPVRGKQRMKNGLRKHVDGRWSTQRRVYKHFKWRLSRRERSPVGHGS